MDILIISGSRADAAALHAVKDGLRGVGHNVSWRAITAHAKGDSRHAIASHAAMVLGTMADELKNHRPELLFIHGDRYETLAVATAAHLMGVPIAHLSGGDLTYGSLDDATRHSITKLAHLHFATCPESARRIAQMGENLENIHVVGDPGVDSLLDTKLLPRDKAFEAVGLPPKTKKFFVCCLHPNTMSDPEVELSEVTTALDSFEGPWLVLIGPNQDAGHKAIDDSFTALAHWRPNTIYCKTLERKVYLSLLRQCTALVGNSSAGFYEAPYLGIPVLNIGDRQSGRPLTAGTIQCLAKTGEIQKNLAALVKAPIKVEPTYPFGDGHAVEKIARVLAKIDNPKKLTSKRFVSLVIGE